MLISEAFAQAAAPAQSEGSLMTLLPLIGIFVIFYLLLIRPQSKRAKEQKLMVGALQRGDEVVTSGGELGKITNVSDSYVIVEIAPSVEVTVVKTAIQTLLPKGTLKEIAPAKSGKGQKATKSQKNSEVKEEIEVKEVKEVTNDTSKNNDTETPKTTRAKKIN